MVLLRADALAGPPDFVSSAVVGHIRDMDFRTVQLEYIIVENISLPQDKKKILAKHWPVGARGDGFLC